MKRFRDSLFGWLLIAAVVAGCMGLEVNSRRVDNAERAATSAAEQQAADDAVEANRERLEEIAGCAAEYEFSQGSDEDWRWHKRCVDHVQGLYGESEVYDTGAGAEVYDRYESQG